MAFKFVVFAACVAIASGGVLSQPLAYSSIAAPLAQQVHYQQAPQQLAYSSIAAPLPQIQYQQAIAAPLAYAGGAAYQRGIGAPIASVFRVDHPLGPQRAPAQIARYAPIAPLQTAHFAQAQIAAPLAAAPVVHSIAPAAPLAKTVVAEEYDPNPQYSYSYDVQDALTGDSKNQFESRNGDVVQGSYSLNDADGTRRIVEYTADPINGFNAVVHKKPLAVAAPAIAAPLAVAGPAIAKIHAPIGYSSIQAPINLHSAIIH